MNDVPCPCTSSQRVTLRNFVAGAPRTRPLCPHCGDTGAISHETAAFIARGVQLREDRQARGLTVREEAQRLGITPQELSKQENGIR